MLQVAHAIKLRPSRSNATCARCFSRGSTLFNLSQGGSFEILKQNHNENLSESDDTLRRKRRTEWKRRQRGQTFLDHTTVHIRAGRGGNGCVAFHREKFVPYGPPSGGNGGRGGDVYIQATPHLTTLSSVPTTVRGRPGANGAGTWLNGKKGAPTIIRVPLGTVVREILPGDPRRGKDKVELTEEALASMSKEDRQKQMRARRWVHYPQHEEDNEQRAEFKEAERALYHQEREVRMAARMRELQPMYMDLDQNSVVEERDPNAPLGTRRSEAMGHLIATGGAGGVGNPHFLTTTNRSPKFATRGWDGERIVLELELKLLADVGLVGMPNAGKSTLLRALTGGRARTEIAGYAFTTLNPVVGVVRVAEDGSFEGTAESLVHDETWAEETREKEMMESGGYADALTRNQKAQDVEDDLDDDGMLEDFRFTVADNPGLIEDASVDVGLGHSFLKSIERSLALVYVVDLSGPAPWDDLRVLRDELEKYKPGMSPKARLVIANKADLLGGSEGEDGEAAVSEARSKLVRLEAFVAEEMEVPDINAEGSVQGTRRMDVVPISAKYSMNLKKVVGLMRGYIEEARSGISPLSYNELL